MNLPNKITLTRICFIPVILLFMLPFPVFIIEIFQYFNLGDGMTPILNFHMSYGKYMGAGIFIIASFTDSIDGFIARKRNQVTNLGIFLDPIADKLLVTAALIVLCQKDSPSKNIYCWAAIIIIAREFLVTGLRLIAASNGNVIAASNLGKIKTIVQIIAVSIALLDNLPFSYFTTFRIDSVFMIIAIIITVYKNCELRWAVF